MGREMKKKSFVFNVEWQEVLLGYPAEVRLEVYDAIIEYVASGTLLELKPMAKMAFSFIKREIDYNNERYQEMVSKRSKAGKKSAEKRYSKESPEEQGKMEDKTNATRDNTCNKTNTCCQVKTNLTDNDNEYDYEYESTDVDDDKRACAHEPPSPPPERSLDKEIDELKADEAWIDQLQVVHHKDVATLKSHLEDFRIHCAANGLEGGHPGGMRDAKQHFNSWLRKRADDERKADGTRHKQAAREAEAAEERRKAEEQREKDRFTPPEGYTSLTWYQEIKRRAANGDAEAQEMLRGRK